MASSPIIAQRSTKSGGTTTLGAEYVIGPGFGILMGDKFGAAPGEIILEGALVPLTPMNGKNQMPTIGTLDLNCVLGRAVIDASSSAAVRFDVASGMFGCVFTHVTFKRCSTPLGAGQTGRLYTTGPVSGVWSEDAAIIPDTIIGGMEYYDIKRTKAYEKLSEPAYLWYRPVAGLGPAGSTIVVEAWGDPEWFTNMVTPAPF
ncbi:hypothetical protein [Methylobacterium marchantiae]|uniref:Uncharacterized protein n=1 Tax=Methylobacterium marchantiae TaxID=600331 RepID=A0ABW3X1I6_9HYPH|nr:hypothetical protein AIGOOFII_3483 [Methylobacterium marchantiae]